MSEDKRTKKAQIPKTCTGNSNLKTWQQKQFNVKLESGLLSSNSKVQDETERKSY